MTKVPPAQQVAGWLCVLGAVGVLAFVAYGFAGPPGPVGLDALWLEPWFLITLADLYLGVVLAMGVVWIRPGTIMGKIGWCVLFGVGGHPGVAFWLGVQLLTGRVQMKTEPAESLGK